MVGDEDMQEMAEDCESVRKELREYLVGDIKLTIPEEGREIRK